MRGTCQPLYEGDTISLLDPYACAMYIVSYINKSQKGTSAVLDQATKEARQGNLDLKRQVRHIGNYSPMLLKQALKRLFT